MCKLRFNIVKGHTAKTNVTNNITSAWYGGGATVYFCISLTVYKKKK